MAAPIYLDKRGPFERMMPNMMQMLLANQLRARQLQEEQQFRAEQSETEREFEEEQTEAERRYKQQNKPYAVKIPGVNTPVFYDPIKRTFFQPKVTKPEQGPYKIGTREKVTRKGKNVWQEFTKKGWVDIPDLGGGPVRKPPSQNFQAKKRVYINPKDGKTWAQDYDYNPKTRKRVKVGEPYRVPSTESLFQLLGIGQGQPKMGGFIEEGYYLDKNGNEVLIQSQEEYDALIGSK